MKISKHMKGLMQFKRDALMIAHMAGATITKDTEKAIAAEHDGPEFAMQSPLGELRGHIYGNWIAMRFAAPGDRNPPHGSFNEHSHKWNVVGNDENRAAALSEFRFRMGWACGRDLSACAEVGQDKDHSELVPSPCSAV